MMLLLCRISPGWDSQDPGLPVMTIEACQNYRPTSRASMSYSMSLVST